MVLVSPVDDTQPAWSGFATPAFRRWEVDAWLVTADPWNDAIIGTVRPVVSPDAGPQGWTAWDPRKLYVGLFPDKQAAGEALIRHAGYEVLA